MDLLARAGRLDELALRGETDRHAQRRLDRLLYEEGRDNELRRRAQYRDKTALYLLVRLLRRRGEQAAAQQAVADIDETDSYALQLAHDSLASTKVSNQLSDNGPGFSRTLMGDSGRSQQEERDSRPN
ncbi:hypothetical protein [Streptosporangium sp. LJ11]|uniref:hypothetical protein n=1 Tax=Streptosporangium sp. LJ11 TaxID=3436927 RepID=UPI003F7AD43F